MAMLLQVGGLLLVILFTLGPILGWMLLLNLRDRRQATLLEGVWRLTPKELSNRIAIQVRCAVLWRRSVVTVEMDGCSRDEVWEALAGWSAHLPPKVRLLVNGAVDRSLSARYTLETTRRPLLCSPHRPSPMPG